MLGTRLADRYELTDELGRGGMGVVFKARDPLLDRIVAVKMLPPGFLKPRAEERFRREARLVAQMDHPAIVPIYDFGHHDGSLFLVMPFLEGTNLRQLIRSRKIVLGEVVEAIAEAADALDYSHDLGVIHRDVKPENIMISRERGLMRVRLMDFGLAREAADTRLTQSGGILGTLSYMSPEQVSSRPLDGRTDLYALGAVLYECLTGEPPFVGQVHALIMRVVQEEVVPPSERGVEVSAELEGIVLRCLAKDPGARPNNGQELARALRQAVAHLGEEAQSRVVGTVEKRPMGGRERPPAPFIGRQEELAVLQRHLVDSFRGNCHFVLVEGDAGAGKSRLLEAFSGLARARGVRVLSGRFTDHRSSLPFQGFCEIIQDYFRHRGLSTSTSELADLSDLMPELLGLFPQLAELAELRSSSSSMIPENTGSVVSGPFPNTSGSSASGPFAGADRNPADVIQVFDLIARTLLRLGGGRPLLLLIDNLHEANVSVEALEYVIRRLGTTPTLVAGTFRPPEVDREHPLNHLIESFTSDPRFFRLALPRLGSGDIREMVASELGSSRLDDSMVTRIHEVSEGNPLFARELIRSLIRGEGVQRDTSGYWRLASLEDLAREALPSTLQQAALRRIDRQPPAARRVLTVASVLGRSFDYEDLEALWDGGKDELDEMVEGLLDDGTLEEEPKTRNDRLRFASGMVQSVVYGELSRRRRRQWHRAYAERLERRYAGRLERVYPQLVHHYAAADMPAATVSYASVQARRSLSTGSADDALRMSRLALEFVDDDEIEDATRQRGELEMIASRAERLAGHLDSANHHAEMALCTFLETGAPEAAEAALLLAEVAWQSRRTEEARAWIERGLETARTKKVGRTLRELLTLGATLANLRGEHGTARYYLEERDRLAAAAPGRPRPLPRGGILVTAAAGTVLSIDPCALRGEVEGEIAASLFDTLLAPGDGAPEPRLAETYRSDDGGHSFVVALRQGAHFSDGSELTAAAVRESLLRCFKSMQGGDLRPALECLAIGDDGLPSIEAHGDREIVFRLREPLPIFPTLLTDPVIAIVRELPDGTLCGTGPFRIAPDPPRAGVVTLDPNPHSFHPAPLIEALEVRSSMDPATISRGLLSGEVDIGRDIQPEDLEKLLRDQRFRSALIETTNKNVQFVLINTQGPVTRHVAVRHALTRIINSHDLVWRTLGRFAQPAVGLIPPGLLGHDPGRRQNRMSTEEARAQLVAGGIATPLRLRAVIHPLMLLRYGELTSALLAAWEQLGLFVEFENLPMTAFRKAYRDNSEVDLLIGRWIADYDDPDDFTFGSFHSEHGRFARYYNSPRADELLELARRETAAGARTSFYRQFEDLLEEEGAVLPLFHSVHYRIAGGRVRGLRVNSNPPYVNYSSLGKLTETDPTEPVPRLGLAGDLRVALPGRVQRLDPALTHLAEYIEVVPMVFETLTRVAEGARVMPWLAADWETLDGGRRFIMRLRRDVRFHDGRRFAARDVRYSFERLLRSKQSSVHFLLLPIRGARAWRDGEASSLAGIFIRSPNEIEFELEEPLSFFPALLSHPATAVLPEGSEEFCGSWRDGCVGTGPYRVLGFEPGERLDLERHLEYWRNGYPKSDNLSFRFGVDAKTAVEELRHGRLAVATELEPADVEALRHEAGFQGAYFEAPRLATYFLVLNGAEGPFADPELRRAFAAAVDVDAAVATAGRLVIRAHGLIPPGLLGHEGPQPMKTGEVRPAAVDLAGTEIRAYHHPIFAGQYAALWDCLLQEMEATGLKVNSEERPVGEILKLVGGGVAHMVGFRWVADYPDTDGFIANLLHSDEGALAAVASHPELDRLIEQGRREVDPGMRHIIYRDAEALIAREALVVPIFHEQIYRFCHPSVRGFRFGISAPEVRYEDLYRKL